MKKTIITALAVAVITVVLAGCKSESTHTSEVHFSKTIDGETEEYTFGAEGNAEISPDNDTADDPDDDVDISDELYDATGYVDQDVSYIWDEEGCKHRIFMQPDCIHVRISYEGLNDPGQLNEQQFREDVIPGWIDAQNNWRKEFDKRGLKDVHFEIQYVSDNEDLVFFTIEDGEVIYNALDAN